MKNKWFNAKKKLPKRAHEGYPTSVPVIAYGVDAFDKEYKYRISVTYNHKIKEWSCNYYMKVLRWMPQPEPPTYEQMLKG